MPSRFLSALPRCARCTRSISTSVPRSSSLSDFNILDPAERPATQIEQIYDRSFKLSDGLLLPGSAIFLNSTSFMWDVPPAQFGWKGWTQDMFKIYETVTPKPDILLLGTGKTVLPPPPFLRKYLNSLGIQLDILDSKNACSTYNLLSEEGRRVSAAVATLEPCNSRTEQIADVATMRSGER